ncbi:MAG: GGDEF domain-containing protein [Candidatus Delongbacteria bacterium]|nr:GGDEF domain-containing protein [Candidatus Delongbacteria bacterium]
MLSQIWQDKISQIDYAFQPIVNIHTGITFGFEALLRDYQKAGHSSIQDFFDSAYREKTLYQVDLKLREKVVDKFMQLPFYQGSKLFYNLDNRVLLLPDYSPGNTCKMLEKKKLHQSSICFEISEKHELVSFIESKSIFNLYKQQTYKIAIDDFGSGFSGLQLLYHSAPDYVKIDRFFIDGINCDSRKKLFVSSIINLAHILGIEVIAEGVETEAEFYACSEIGADYIQGYLIQCPTQDITQIRSVYPEIPELNKKNRRDKQSDHHFISNQLDPIEPICIPDHDMRHLFDTFRRNKNRTFIPIVNQQNEPLGIINEKDLKEFVYSPYGKELLINKSSEKKLMDFITRIPVSEITNRIERVLKSFSMNENGEGVLITYNGKYKGFLSAKALLNAINEKNLSSARDQNPLSKLPGNHLINEYICQVMENDHQSKCFIYFDFNHFKPFNDYYGFRLGDRAILIFADILRQYSISHHLFIGHIGGDDFFGAAQYSDLDIEDWLELTRDIIRQFSEAVIGLYPNEERRQGYIECVDRDGVMRKFPLLSVCAALLFIHQEPVSPEHKPNESHHRYWQLDRIGQIIAELKKKAKTSESKIAYQCIDSKYSPILQVQALGSLN